MLTTMLICGFIQLRGQIAVSIDNSAPDPSAMLDVSSTTKGALLPRMTMDQIKAITNPADGLQVYCKTTGKMYIYVFTVGQWKEIAYGTEIINPPFSCGIPVTINHKASGNVAPVNKIVTYGTVNNIPGEPAKCWITNNLGADHQATAVTDSNESSRGWYWQFNRKQGYKHDGTNRTPNTVWETYNFPNLDWQSVNDPCTIELGFPWRVPTKTEWYNVKTNGWTNTNDPWNSGLKLHCAGALDYTDGTLFSSGIMGQFWSGTKYDFNDGHTFQMIIGQSINSSYNVNYFGYGNSIRCIRD